MTSAASPTGRAHPRSRGENWSDRLYTSDTWGSSPLTRGKPARRGLEGMVRRLIPAHAGKTTVAALALHGNAAHPRSRGENLPVLHPSMTVDGSSPLTRGKPQRRRGRQRGHRLIPAHAGKTSLPSRWRRPARAHPRSRGENMNARFTSRATCGSSPLTRGKLLLVVISASHFGLIPAHAGKTRGGRRLRVPVAAHPRSRGENKKQRMRSPASNGSSPLTRGKHRQGVSFVLLSRLIPAHAGKTHLSICDWP